VNILFIPLITLTIFIFGYLYYAKLVWLQAFNGDDPPREKEADYLNSNTSFVDIPGKNTELSRHVSFVSHVAALASTSTLGGVAIALFWGWIPAFLWLVASAAVAGGVYGMGSLWLSLRHPGRGPEEIALQVLGPWLSYTLLLFTILMSTLMAALMVWLASQLLVSHPDTVLTCMVLPILAYGLGKWWRNNLLGETGAVFLLVIIPLFIMATIYLTDSFPISFSGAINLDMGGEIKLSIASGVLWAVIILGVTGHGAAQILRMHTRPRCFVTGSLLALLLLIALCGAVMIHPEITAQGFKTPVTGPGPLPWVFVTITSGAIAGYHMLIANGVTAKLGVRGTEIRYIGYGGALAESAIAITAIMVIAAGFGSEKQWLGFYADWQGIQDLPRLLELYINGFSRYATGAGFETAYAKSLATVILFAISATTLEVMLRILRQNLDRLQALRSTPVLKNETRRFWVGLLLVAITSLLVIPGSKTIPFWPLLGISDLALAAIFLVLMSIVLTSMKRMGNLLLTLAGTLTLILVGTGITRMAQSWSSPGWLELVMLVLLILMTCLALYKGIQFARVARVQRDGLKLVAQDNETAENVATSSAENKT